uniref:Putative secreted protein n=1 Tax=Anopheles triannulatus TaxID=58253 RepID=A0A2M4B7B1_9DIPT
MPPPMMLLLLPLVQRDQTLVLPSFRLPTHPGGDALREICEFALPVVGWLDARGAINEINIQFGMQMSWKMI